MIDRRMHGKEFRTVLDCGESWFRVLRNKGVVPKGRTDPGGRRLWWTESEVKATIARLKDPQAADQAVA